MRSNLSSFSSNPSGTAPRRSATPPRVDPDVGRHVAAGQQVDPAADAPASRRRRRPPSESSSPRWTKKKPITFGPDGPAQRGREEDRDAEERHQEREGEAVEDVVEAERDDQRRHEAVTRPVELGGLPLEDQRPEDRQDRERDEERRGEPERAHRLPDPLPDEGGDQDEDDHHRDARRGDERHGPWRDEGARHDADQQGRRDEERRVAELDGRLGPRPSAVRGGGRDFVRAHLGSSVVHCAAASPASRPSGRDSAHPSESCWRTAPERLNEFRAASVRGVFRAAQHRTVRTPKGRCASPALEQSRWRAGYSAAPLAWR